MMTTPHTNPLKTSNAEKLIWHTIRQDKACPSNTLSYQIHIENDISDERIQSGIFHLLTHQCIAFNYRFFESHEVLYKQFQEPSTTPVYIHDHAFNNQKTIIPPFRHILYEFHLNRTANNKSVLVIHLSHLIFDGACFKEFCDALSETFSDYEPCLNKHKKSGMYNTHETPMLYWEKTLKNKSVHQSLPFLPDVPRTTYVSHEQCLAPDLFEQLTSFRLEHKTTVFQTLLSSLGILLHTYSQQSHNKISISYCVSQKQPEDTIGCYVNILPLFISSDDQDTSLDIINKVKKERQEQRPNQHLSLTTINNLVDTELNQHKSLFNVLVNHSPGICPLQSPVINNQPCQLTSIENRSSHRDLSLIYNFNEHGMVLRIESNRGEFSRELIEQFMFHLIESLKFVITGNENHSLSELTLSALQSPISKGRVVDHSNTNMLRIIQSHTKQDPQKIAIHTESLSMSYTDVLRNIADITRTLSTFDQEELIKGVGIFLPRQASLPIALVSCLCMNVPFVPLSMDLPDKSINDILHATQLSIVMVDKNSRLKLNGISNLQLFEIDVLNQPHESTLDIPNVPRLRNDIAYTLFTSGTTGIPKGVLVTHDNLMNFLHSMRYKPGFSAYDNLLAMTPISFDISINELLLPLFTGGMLYVATNEQKQNPEILIEIINKHLITTIQATPSHFQLLKQQKWSCQQSLTLWMGGEALNPALAKYFIDQGHQVINMYGPTEATIWASCERISTSLPITLGTAVDNSSFYVLNSQQTNPAYGQAGQLFISGDCVANGYSNHDNTAFSTLKSGIKGYFTGDKVVAYGLDKIVFVKRQDEQVKVRGYRVELNEINTMIESMCSDVDIVTVLRHSPEDHLCAFYTTSNQKLLDSDNILSTLHTLLPDYKIPQALIYLTKFPLTSSGKIDKSTLSNLSLAELCPLPLPITQETHNLTSFEEVKTKLTSLINIHFQCDVPNHHTPLTQLGFNSISFTTLSGIIQNEFGATYKPHQFYQASSIEKIVQRIHEKMPSLTTAKALSSSQKTKIKPRIAIIAYDALLPGGLNADEFWQALAQGRDLIATHQRPSLHTDEKAGFIENILAFDRHFFNISPREAAYMDPRQRLLLQCAWKTLEQGGYKASELKGNNIACFIAATGNDYLLAQSKSALDVHAYSLTGNAFSMLANRLSYFFDWLGPSVAIDTACSGSLSALIRGCEQLYLGKCNMAFVAGVNLIVDSHLSDALRAGNFLSTQAHCASFSDQADGYVRGEGVIGFLLKPYEDAIKDGDVIHGIIESATENHGGHAQSLTAPNQQAQTQLLVNAYHDSLAEKVSYIETHGTGTKLGDPIEIDALKAFEAMKLTRSTHKIKLGSVKSNIGHLEACAGFASMIKVLLAMKHHKIPKNLHFNTLNEYISLEGSRFSILNTPEPWLIKNKVAGVSSFGFGGANTHIVLSNADMGKTGPQKNMLGIIDIVLSAKTLPALEERIKNLYNDLIRLPEEYHFNDVAFTLTTGREIFKYSVLLKANSNSSLINQLNQMKKNITLCSKFPTTTQSFHPHIPYRRVPLTPYSFDEADYNFTQLLSPKRKTHSSLISLIDMQKKDKNNFIVRIDEDHIFFKEHRVFNSKVLPGMAHLELAIKALQSSDRDFSHLKINGFYWLRPLIANPHSVTFSIQINDNGPLFNINLRNSQKDLISYGCFTKLTDLPLPPQTLKEITARLINNKTARYTAKTLYDAFSSLGIDYGDYFKGIRHVDVYKNIARSTLNITSQGSIVSLLDSALQSGMALSLTDKQHGLMPFTIGEMIIHQMNALNRMDHAVVYIEKLSLYRSNIFICDQNESCLVSIRDLGVKPSTLNKQDDALISTP